MNQLVLAGLALVALLLCAGGLWLWWQGRSEYAAAGLPSGDIVTSDVGVERTVDRPLISHRHGLVGRPDYLMRIRHAGKSCLIPIEVKSARSPATPYDSHQMQLLTYCILVEEETGERPPYGLLRYRDRTHTVAFTKEAEAQVLACAAAIRAARQQKDVVRSHADQSICRHCGYQGACGSGALQ